VFNVNELLLCALPYHATPEFARLLVLLQLKGSTWEWLEPGQQSGAPPPRDIIVRRCINDHVSSRLAFNHVEPRSCVAWCGLRHAVSARR
jgi:U3 small nucleolar RNA-associated protein 10